MKKNDTVSQNLGGATKWKNKRAGLAPNQNVKPTDNPIPFYKHKNH